MGFLIKEQQVAFIYWKPQKLYVKRWRLFFIKSESHLHWITWEGMGDVGSVRYEPALLPPCPTVRVFSYSNCQEFHPLQFQSMCSGHLIQSLPREDCQHATQALIEDEFPCMLVGCSLGTDKEDLFIGPQEFVVGYSKAPEQPQSRRCMPLDV